MVNKENLANDYMDLMANVDPNTFDKLYPSQEAEDAGFDKIVIDLENYKVTEYINYVKGLNAIEREEDFQLMINVLENLNILTKEKEYKDLIRDYARNSFGTFAKKILDTSGSSGTIGDEVINEIINFESPVSPADVKAAIGRVILKYIKNN